jgi:quercetin dioxygenase-like cupin family protein
MPWTANEPLTIDFAFAPVAAGWRDGPGTRFSSRDLGLAEASGGWMSARHCRGLEAPIGAPSPADFRFLYVLAGAVTVGAGTGGSHTLSKGGVALFGPDAAPHLSGASGDLEWIEIAAAKSGFGPSSDDEATPPALYLDETPESFVAGAGPRRYFAYRDLATAPFTGRRIHVHVVKALEPMPGGTGWHNHTMSQLFVVLTGWAKIAVEGRGERVMRRGDAMCLRAGMRHDVPAYSADYTVLEMCVPADYDTTATAAPRV